MACELAASCLETQIVSVADCECDIDDIFLETQGQKTPADFVIRAKQDRCLPEHDPAAGANAYHRVADEVATSPLMTTRPIDLPQTPKQEARQATLEIRATQVQVRPPDDRSDLEEVTYNVVLPARPPTATKI